jgi:hypothetical protein
MRLTRSTTWITPSQYGRCAGSSRWSGPPERTSNSPGPRPLLHRRSGAVEPARRPRRRRVRAVFSQKISIWVKIHPELEAALTPCPGNQEVPATSRPPSPAHEMKRLVRNAAKLMTLAATLQGADVQPELLTGIYHPPRHELHAVRRLRRGRLTRPRLHPGQDPRRPTRRGQPQQHGGRPPGHRRRHARLRPPPARHRCPHLRDRQELTIKTGKHASVASLYRALAHRAVTVEQTACSAQR